MKYGGSRTTRKSNNYVKIRKQQERFDVKGYVGQGTYQKYKKTQFKNIKAHLKAKDKQEDPTENGGTKSRRIL